MTVYLTLQQTTDVTLSLLHPVYLALEQNTDVKLSLLRPVYLTVLGVESGTTPSLLGTQPTGGYEPGDPGHTIETHITLELVNLQ